MAAPGVAGDEIPAVAAVASTVNRLLHCVRAAVALRPAVVAALCLSAFFPAFAQYSTVTYLSREEAAPIFAALEEPLPRADEWKSWSAARDRDTPRESPRATSIVSKCCFRHLWNPRTRLRRISVE